MPEHSESPRAAAKGPHQNRPTGEAKATSASDATTDSYSAGQLEALEHARHLAEHGVPLFLAQPAKAAGKWDPQGGHNGSGYWFPKGWENAEADPAVVDRWRPGLALCAVMGHAVDAVDVDAQHDGDVSAQRLIDAGQWPRTYGRQRTASGGWHDLVAPLGVGSCADALPGVDLRAGTPEGTGRGFIFLAPTRKLSKLTGRVGTYRWTDAPDLSQVDPADATGRALVAARPKGRESTSSAADRRVGPAGVQAAIARECSRVAWAEEGMRNHVLNTAAFNLGQLVGDYLSADEVREVLAEHAAEAGLEPDEVQATIESGLASGMAKPRTTGPLPQAADPSSSWLANGLTVEFWTDTTPPEAPKVLEIKGTEGGMFGVGRVSRLFGLSGSAKSWAAKAAVLERLRAGESVLYLDADGIRHEFRDHMRLLGLTDEEAIAAIQSGRLHHVRVEGSLISDEARALLKRGWGLVVLDGFNNALTASAPAGRSGLDATEVNVFFQSVLWPAADAGAAVVVIDHMRKEGDSDHGSVQKRNNLTGTDYAIKRVGIIAPDVVGYSEVRLTHKDRSGWATATHAKRGKDASDPFVYVVVDSRQEGSTAVSVVLDLPADLRASNGGPEDAVHKDARALLDLLRAVPEGFKSNRDVRLALQERGQGMDNTRINAAAELLVGHGVATRGEGVRGALTIQAVPEAEDEL